MKRIFIILLLLIFCMASVSAGVINSSVKFYMPANGTAGDTTFVDISQNGYTINAYGDTKIANANNSWRFNNASYFDGTGDVIYSSPQAINFSTSYPWSISFWMNSSGTAGAYGILLGNMNKTARSDGEFRVASMCAGSSQFALFTNNGADVFQCNSSVNLNDGKWHYIVVSRINATCIRGWYDGIKAIDLIIASTAPVGSNTRNLTIGWQAVDNVYYTGYLDDIAIINGTAIDGSVVPAMEFGDTAPAAPADPIVADFTQSANPSAPGQAVVFTDTSTGSPTTWNWSIDTTVTNTTQNIAYVFPSIGTYYVNLSVTNATGSTSSSNQTHTVSNATGFANQDVWLSGQYLQTFYITDSGTLAPITNVSIVSSSGKSYQTTNGTGYLTEPFGLYTITFSSEGYYPRTITYVFDADASHAVALTETGAGTTDINLQGTPKDVKFHIQSFWGAPITNANVTIQGISTTTGSWDWVATLLSIDLVETPIQNTSMSGLTDTNGDAVFLMLDSLKYNISVSKAGYTFPLTYISPQASTYTISANMNESWFSSGNDTLKEVNVSVSWVTKNSTHAFVNITYQDDTGTTTGGDIKVYQRSAGRAVNASPIAVMNVTASSCSNSTVVEVPTGGASYVVDVNATTSTGTNIKRTFAHDFKGQPVNLPGFTPETQLWLAMFILIFTAAFAGVLHAPQMSIVLCVELWAFWAIRWFDHLIDGNGYTEVVLVTMFILATFAAFVWNITEGKSKGKRSS